MIKILTIFGGVLAAAYGSVSDIEILLVVVTTIGLLYGFYNIREMYRAWIILHRQGKTDHGPHYDARMVVAINGLRSEIARVLIQLWLVTLGVIAMTIPETPPYIHEPFKLVIFGFIFRWGIIGTSLLLSLKSYWGYQVRQRVNEHYGEGEPEDQP